MIPTDFVPSTYLNSKRKETRAQVKKKKNPGVSFECHLRNLWDTNLLSDTFKSSHAHSFCNIYTSAVLKMIGLRAVGVVLRLGIVCFALPINLLVQKLTKTHTQKKNRISLEFHLARPVQCLY